MTEHNPELGKIIAKAWRDPAFKSTNPPSLSSYPNVCKFLAISALSGRFRA